MTVLGTLMGINNILSIMPANSSNTNDWGSLLLSIFTAGLQSKKPMTVDNTNIIIMALSNGNKAMNPQATKEPYVPGQPRIKPVNPQEVKNRIIFFFMIFVVVLTTLYYYKPV